MGIRDDLLRAVKKGEVALIVLANFLKVFQTVRYKKNSSDNKALFHFFFKIFLRRPTSYLSNRSDFVQIDVQIMVKSSKRTFCCSSEDKKSHSHTFKKKTYDKSAALRHCH